MNVLAPVASVLVIGSIVLLALISGIHPAARRRLQIIVFAAFLVRLGLAVAFELYPRARIFHDDAAGYEVTAIALSRYWQGAGPPLIQSWKGLYNYGYLFIGGTLCYLFGNYPLQLSVWNALFGSVSVVVVYRLAATLFHPIVAMRAAVLLAFMPSMILWSAVAIKDPVMVLLVTTSLYLYLLLRKRFSLVLVFLLAGAVIGMFFVRFYVSYYIALSILATAVMGRAQDGFKLGRNLLVLLALLVMVAVSGLGSSFSEGLEAANLERAATFRLGMAYTANSGFARDLDVSSWRGASTALPIGLSVLFFGPFPWQMKGLLPLMTLPEMLFWWSLLPALWRGLRFAVRRAFSRTSPLLVFCLSLSLSYAITLGNVGAAVRQRAQIFVFLFIFVALGESVKLCRRRHVDPSLLLKPLTRA